jgi:hypothetical protein
LIAFLNDRFSLLRSISRFDSLPLLPFFAFASDFAL